MSWYTDLRDAATKSARKKLAEIVTVTPDDVSRAQLLPERESSLVDSLPAGRSDPIGETAKNTLGAARGVSPSTKDNTLASIPRTGLSTMTTTQKIMAGVAAAGVVYLIVKGKK